MRAAIRVWSLCAICAQVCAQPSDGGSGGRPPPGGGGGGTAPDSTSGGTSSCTGAPCAAPLLNDVALTTASGTDTRTGNTFSAGENIYGPFEAGFGEQQNGILEGLGCENGNDGHVPGGIDTNTAEQMVAKGCNIQLPRVVGDEYKSLLDECGGHTSEYHFHEKLSCLYELSGAHSTQVGQASDGQYIYGKWEDYSASELPKLDACGGHFGVTPDSNGVVTYHYHVQDSAPFTIGCYGPTTDSNGDFKLVTLTECRNLYDECGNGDTITVDTPSGSKQYDPWCPCYDATGSNVGTEELAVFSDTSAITCSGDACSTASYDSSGGSSGDSTGDSSSNASSSTAMMFHQFSIAAIATIIAHAMATPLV